jgi:hypothetical protein
MHFHPVQTHSNIRQTQKHVPYGWTTVSFGPTVHTLSWMCSWIILFILPTLTHYTLTQLSCTAIHLFPKMRSYMWCMFCDSCRLHVSMWQVSNLFTAFGKLVAPVMQLYIKRSLPHILHLIYKNFHQFHFLFQQKFEGTVLFYTWSNSVW